MTTMKMELTASRVDAFDDWFSTLDDDDDEFATSKVISPKMATVSSGEFDDDDDESWLDSSDDEKVKNKKKKKKKNKAEENAFRQSGDLEKLFCAAGFDAAPAESRSSPGSGDGRKKENKALQLLRNEAEKRAQKIVKEQAASRRNSIDRRKNITDSIERQLSSVSASSGEDDVIGNDKPFSSPETRTGRPKRSPHRNKRDGARPAIQLSALYGHAPLDDSAVEKGTKAGSEGVCQDVKVQPSRNDIPRHQSSDRRKPRSRSRDPLSRSRHGPTSRSVNIDGSSRLRDPLSMSAHHPRERKSLDSLSRSSHGRPRMMTRELSLSRRDPLSASSHGSLEKSGNVDPIRRRSSRDPLSASAHHPRGSESRREHRSRRDDPLSRSSHGEHRTRHSSHAAFPHSPPRHSSKTNDRKNGYGLSASVHGPPRHREDERHRSRSPADWDHDARRRLSRGMFENKDFDGPSDERLERAGKTSSHRGLPRRRSDPTLINSGEHRSKREALESKEEELLRLAIGNIKINRDYRSLPGSRIERLRREGTSVFEHPRRRSRSPHGL